MFFRSPSGTSLAAPAFRTSAVLLTGTDSPVSAASSIFMLALSKIRPSAGTASPASRITISPGTSSSLFFTSIFPPRITFDVAAAISCRASIAFSALLSCRTPSTALMMTTVRIMTTSAYDSPSYADVMPEISAAASRIRIIGSFSSSKNRCRLLFFFPAASRLGPCSESRRAASVSESPCSVVCNSSRIFELFSRYSFISIRPFF